MRAGTGVIEADRERLRVEQPVTRARRVGDYG